MTADMCTAVRHECEVIRRHRGLRRPDGSGSRAAIDERALSGGIMAAELDQLCINPKESQP